MQQVPASTKSEYNGTYATADRTVALTKRTCDVRTQRLDICLADSPERTFCACKCTSSYTNEDPSDVADGRATTTHLFVSFSPIKISRDLSRSVPPKLPILYVQLPESRDTGRVTNHESHWSRKSQSPSTQTSLTLPVTWTVSDHSGWG